MLEFRALGYRRGTGHVSGFHVWSCEFTPKTDGWTAIFDIKKPEDPINAGYIWLPIEFEADESVIRWRDTWDFSVFSNP